MGGSSSVDIELSRLYVFARLRTMLEGSQTGDAGAFVRSIDLRELAGPAADRPLSALVIQLEPWIRNPQSGEPAPIGRFYRLTLRITPHVITPASVPDQTRRRQLLCSTNEPNCSMDRGALLTFDLHELQPACDPADLADARIRPKIYSSLAGQRPLRLPTGPVAVVLNRVTDTTSDLIDVNVSADGFLKIGLEYEIAGMAQAAHAFDRATQALSRYPDNDWFVNIDASILRGGVRSRIADALAKKAPGSSLYADRFEVLFLPGEVRVAGVAALPVPGVCGSTADVRFSANNPTRMCKRGDDTSAIVGYPEIEGSSGNFCVSVVMFFGNLIGNVNVGTVSGPPVGEWPTIATVSFPVGEDDTFYGTTLDLDNTFSIIGRSSFMDRRAAGAGTPRSDAPGKCPGVP
jgi:hypothetical protein